MLYNLQQIRIFVEAARHQNFHRTAEALRMAQPAVSKHVRKLEDILGVDLFERLPRGVKLTKIGERIAAELEGILMSMDQVPKLAQQLKQGTRGTLRIGMNEAGYSCSFTNRIIREFRSRFPLVEVDVFPMHSQRQLECIDRGEIDVGLLLRTYVNPVRFRFLELTPVTLCMAIYNQHPLARLDTVSVEDLRGETLILTAAEKEEVPTMLNFLGVTSTSVRTSPSTEVTLQLVATQFGIAPVSSIVLGASTHPDLKLVPLREQPENLFTCLVWDEERMSEPLRNFTQIGAAIRNRQ
jgi:DNA-binding transcriptional LysR family regulator